MEKMKIKKETWRKAGMIAGSTVAAALVVLGIVFGAKQCARTANADPLGEEETTDRNLLYGIEYENYDVVTEQVGNGQTLSHILGSLGVGPATVDRIDRGCKPVFDMRGMRAGHPYTAFLEQDSLGRRLCHFV